MRKYIDHRLMLMLCAILINCQSTANIPTYSLGRGSDLNAQDYKQAADSLSLRIHFMYPHELANPIDTNTILSSPTPKETYQSIVQQIVYADELRFFLTNYYMRLFNLPYNTSSEKEAVDMAVNTIMNDLDMTGMYTLQNPIDEQGQEKAFISTSFIPPLGKRAGPITTYPMQKNLAGNGFSFNTSRDIFIHLFCSNAPVVVKGAQGWSSDSISPKYTFDSAANLNCIPCHAGGENSLGLNQLRYAFRFFNNDGKWDESLPAGNMFGHEPSAPNNTEIVEPNVSVGRSKDDYFILKNNGAVSDDPAVLISEVLQFDEVNTCMTKRVLSWVTGQDEGKSGNGGYGPYDWAQSQQEKNFLDDQKTNFIGQNKDARALMLSIVKDDRFVHAQVRGNL